MNQLASIQRLTNRLHRIEREITAMRQELQELPHEVSATPSEEKVIPPDWVDKAVLRKQMQHLFLTLSIEGSPVGIKALQEHMRRTILGANELSNSIIAAREE
jgi:hypothetical protein